MQRNREKRLSAAIRRHCRRKRLLFSADENLGLRFRANAFLYHQDNEKNNIELPMFTRGESDQDFDLELGLSKEDDVSDEKKKQKLQKTMQIKILDFVSFVFFFPLAFVTYCIW